MINDRGTTSLDGLSFYNQDWLLTGDNIRFRSRSIEVHTAHNVTIGNNIELESNGLFGVTGPGLLTLFAASGATITINGQINGNGAINKTGGGTLPLNHPHFYVGGTNVNGGILGDKNASGNYNNNAVIDFHTATSQTLSGTIVGAGFTRKFGAGTLTLAGAHSHTGGTDVYEGHLIDLNPYGDYQTLGGLEFRTSGTRSYAGTIVDYGDGNFTKSGSGTLTLTGTNYFRNGVTMAEGALVDMKPEAASYRNSGILVFGRADSYEYSGAITGTGLFAKNGAGTLTLSGLVHTPVAPSSKGVASRTITRGEDTRSHHPQPPSSYSYPASPGH